MAEQSNIHSIESYPEQRTRGSLLEGYRYTSREFFEKEWEGMWTKVWLLMGRESELADNDAYEQWSENGARDMAYRANLRWKKLLDDYQAPPLDESVNEALLDFISEKKSASADAWY